jgi:FdhD protein
MTKPTQTIQYVQYTSGGSKFVKNGNAIVEQSVSLTVNGEFWLTFMCTPMDIEPLAVGFLFNEGVLCSTDEIAQVHLCATGDNVDVWLNHSVEKPDHWSRTSGCTGGMTGLDISGSQNGESSLVNFDLSKDETVIQSEHVTLLVEKLLESQDLYQQTGGVHTSVLTDGYQTMIVAEDIGRHNTIDKIAGKCLLENISLSQRILLSTGRISAEMLQKAARLGVSIIISRTAASSLAIELAQRWGITLIGYARRNHFNVYSGYHRVIHQTKTS